MTLLTGLSPDSLWVQLRRKDRGGRPAPDRVITDQAEAEAFFRSIN